MVLEQVELPKVCDPESESNFVFISYSHANKDQVYGDLIQLQHRKVKFWYDKGLHVGEQWNKKVGVVLGKKHCKGVIFYVSSPFCLSDAIAKEVAYVRENQIPYCWVFLEEVESIDQCLTREGVLQTLFPDHLTRATEYREFFNNDKIFVLHSDPHRFQTLLKMLMDWGVVDEQTCEAAKKREALQHILFIGKSSRFTNSLLNGVQAYFASDASNANVQVENYTVTSPHSEQEILEMLDAQKQRNRYSCLMLRLLQEPSEEFLQRFTELLPKVKSPYASSLPVILLDLPVPQRLQAKYGRYFHYVGSDFTRGGQLLGETIVRLLNRSNQLDYVILLLEGPKDKRSVQLRCDGLSESLRKQIPEERICRLAISSLDYNKEQERIRAFLQHHRDRLKSSLCFLFCGNDTIAERMIMEYYSADSPLRACLPDPERVVFIGYDGIRDAAGDIALAQRPGHTMTIDVSPFNQGVEAAALAERVIYPEPEPVDTERLTMPLLINKTQIPPLKYPSILPDEVQKLCRAAQLFIFDLDGTIADTERLHWRAYNELLALPPYGVALDDEHIARYIGNPEISIYQMIERDFNIRINRNEFLRQRIEKYLELVEREQLRPFDYLADLRRQFPEKRYVLLTSQVPDVVNKLLDIWELNDVFKPEDRLSVHDAKVSKREVLSHIPQHYHMQVEPGEVLLFEDADHTLAIAEELGIPSIGIEHHYNRNRLNHCHAVISTTREVCGLFVGLCGMDYIYEVGKIPAEDSKARTHAFRTAMGGPATNAAITFASLGGRAILVTCIGDSVEGDNLRASLRSLGIEVIDLAARQKSLPNHSSIFVNPCNGSRTVVSGQNLYPTFEWQPEHLQKLVDRSDFCLYDCNLQNIPLPLIEVMHQKGNPVVLDGGSWKLGVADYLALCTDLIASARFMEQVAKAHAEWLLDSIPFRASTHGAEPLKIYHDADDPTPDFPVKLAVESVGAAVDTLGAGDVFHGAYCYYRFVEGCRFVEALRRASKVAAYKVTQVGIVDALRSFRSTR